MCKLFAIVFDLCSYWRCHWVQGSWVKHLLSLAFLVYTPLHLSSFPTDCSKAEGSSSVTALLCLFCAYVELVLSLFVPHLSFSLFFSEGLCYVKYDTLIMPYSSFRQEGK